MYIIYIYTVCKYTCVYIYILYIYMYIYIYVYVATPHRYLLFSLVSRRDIFSEDAEDFVVKEMIS